MAKIPTTYNFPPPIPESSLGARASLARSRIGDGDEMLELRDELQGTGFFHKGICKVPRCFPLMEIPEGSRLFVGKAPVSTRSQTVSSPHFKIGKTEENSVRIHQTYLFSGI